MKITLFIALGGALGAVGRHWLATYINSLHLSSMLLGTLVVNIIGSFFMGMAYILIVEKLYLHPDWRSVMMVGFFGAFTTFSTFSLEAVSYLENGQLLMAVSYVTVSVLFCTVATGLAMWFTRLV